MIKKGVIGIVEDKSYFNSETYINLESTDVKRLLALIIKNILNKSEEYLPDWISKKRAIINIQNRDEKCFLWCILRYIYPRDKNDT